MNVLVTTGHQLLQEKYSRTGNARNDAWRVLVVCTMLNMTHGTQADPVIEHLFDRWPTPAKMALADQEKLREVINHLGFGSKRSEHLVEMSKQFVQLRSQPLEDIDVEDLRGCGEYAMHAWQMFVAKRTDFWPRDKELRRRMRELRGEVFDWDEAVALEHAEKKAEREKKKLVDEHLAEKVTRSKRRDSELKSKREPLVEPKKHDYVKAVTVESQNRERTRKKTRHVAAQERKK